MINNAITTKTKQEILEFLKTSYPKSEIDELAIEQYCLRKGIVFSFANNEIFHNNISPVTYPEFKLWADGCIPVNGDIITLENNKTKCVGIVKGSDIDSITFHVLLEADKLKYPNIVTERKEYQQAGTNEKLLLQSALSVNKIDWHHTGKLLINKFISAENKAIRVSLLGHKLGIGIFKEIDEHGQIVMYCYKEEGKPVDCSLKVDVGLLNDYQIETCTAKELNNFRKDLALAGVKWNGHLKRIEPLNYRLSIGQSYYFINDRFEVLISKENNRFRDTQKFKAANYFHKADEAKELVKFIMSICKYLHLPNAQSLKSYYYINDKFEISHTFISNTMRPSDKKRFECNNCFISLNEAQALLLKIDIFRKQQLSEICNK